MIELTIKLIEELEKEYPEMTVNMDTCTSYILQTGDTNVDKFHDYVLENSLYTNLGKREFIMKYKIGDILQFKKLIEEHPEKYITFVGKVLEVKSGGYKLQAGEIHNYVREKDIIRSLVADKMKTENLVISKERVLTVAKENPCARIILKSLFPEAFEDNSVFCKIGTTFHKKLTPKNTYAVFKWNGEVRILNITGNYMWKLTSNKVSELKDPKGETLTVSEFKRLTGYTCLDDFIFSEND